MSRYDALGLALTQGGLTPRGHECGIPQGPISWRLPDGTDAEGCKRMVRVAVTLLGSSADVARLLSVSAYAVNQYMMSAATIPRHVGQRLPRVMAALTRDVSAKELHNAEAIADNPCFAVGSVVNHKANSADRTAREQFREAIKRGREAHGWTYTDVAAKIGGTTTTMERAEHDGLTPVSIWYKPLCKLYGLDPASFGWIGHLANLAAADAEPMMCEQCVHFAMRPSSKVYGECDKWVRRKQTTSIACEAFEWRTGPMHELSTPSRCCECAHYGGNNAKGRGDCYLQGKQVPAGAYACVDYTERSE